jgi:hypothetical protein
MFWHLAHYLSIGAPAEQQRCAGMTQIVKARLRQSCLGEKPQKSTVNVPSDKRVAELCAEDQAAIYISFSNGRSFCLLLFSVAH